MRVVLRTLALVFLTVSVLIVLEARFPAFDGLTVHEPAPMRSLAGSLALREYGPGDADLDRVLRLDPANTLAWERRCTALLGPTPADWVSDCRRALKLDASGPNYRMLGAAQEQASQYCAAEASYRASAAQPDMAGMRPVVLRDAARAALNCGDTAGSLTLLHTAEQIDEASAANALAPEESQRARDALASDRGYMSVVYQETHQPDKARQMCFEANPGSADCACQLTGTGLICAPQPAPTLISAR